MIVTIGTISQIFNMYANNTQKSETNENHCIHHITNNIYLLIEFNTYHSITISIIYTYICIYVLPFFFFNQKKKKYQYIIYCVTTSTCIILYYTILFIYIKKLKCKKDYSTGTIISLITLESYKR